MIDLIGTLRRIAAAVGTIPTTVMRGTDNALLAADYETERGTDNALLAADYETERGTDNAALAATWTDALATALANYTAARAGYLDELAAGNLPSDIDDLLSDTSVLDHKWESRTRVYPQSTIVTPQVTTALAADTFGSWVEIIPIDTVDFDYRLLEVEIEETNRAGVFLLQFGYSTVDGSDPTTAQIVGERRIKMVGTPLKLEQASKNIYGGHIPANAKLWARVKSSTGTVDILDISVILTRCLEVTNPIVQLTTWPWA